MTLGGGTLYAVDAASISAMTATRLASCSGVRLVALDRRTGPSVPQPTITTNATRTRAIRRRYEDVVVLIQSGARSRILRARRSRGAPQPSANAPRRDPRDHVCVHDKLAEAATDPSGEGTDVAEPSPGSGVLRSGDAPRPILCILLSTLAPPHPPSDGRVMPSPWCAWCGHLAEQPVIEHGVVPYHEICQRQRP